MSETTTYTVTGMTCGHCAASVTEEISEIAGVEAVDVVVETGAVTVTSATPLDHAGRPRRRRGGRLRRWHDSRPPRGARP